MKLNTSISVREATMYLDGDKEFPRFEGINQQGQNFLKIAQGNNIIHLDFADLETLTKFKETVVKFEANTKQHLVDEKTRSTDDEEIKMK